MKKILIIAAIALITLTACEKDEPKAGYIVDKGWDEGYFIEVEIDGEGYVKRVSPEENAQLDIGDWYVLE